MPTRFSVVLDDDRAQEIECLARQNDLTEEEVLRQLLDLGLEALDGDRPGERRPDHVSAGSDDTAG